MQHRIRNIVLAAAAAVVPVTSAIAAPYVSGITINGTTVSFVLNENTDSLSLSINGGAPTPLATTRGTQSFNLGSASDKFSLTASKVDTVGWSIGNGGVVPLTGSGLSVDSNQAGLNLISDDTNILNRFNSPRGVAVNNNPRAGARFGTAYIANSAAGTFGGGNGTTIPTGPTRTLTDGLYALNADQSDALGFGDTAQVGNIAQWATTLSGSAPFRLNIGKDNTVFIADFSDATGSVYHLSPTLTGGGLVLAGAGGPNPLPAGQNHGSSTAVYTEGSIGEGNLVVYTLDEDLTNAQFGGPAGDNRNSLWRYDIGSGPYESTVVPTRVNATNVLLPLATSDLDRGLVDGKFYLAQNRSAGNEAGITVLNSDGTVAFNSLEASRTLLENPAAPDILRNILAMDVSDDQKWMAILLNNSDVCVVPLVNGIPDIANRLVVDSGAINSGRDIAFDAAGNIHYASSGQAVYRVLSPGGTTVAVTSWDGSNFSFALNPSTPSIVKGDFGGNESSNGSFNTPDGSFNELDVEGFLLALNDQASYLVLNPSLSSSLIGMGDFGGNESTNGSFNTPDGAFNELDVEGFLLALNDPAGYAAIQPPGLGGVSAIPEPAALGLLAPLGLLLSRRRRA